jgi:hypothetical protein
MDLTNFPAAYWLVSFNNKELLMIAVAGNRFIV